MKLSSHPSLRGACSEARDWLDSLPPETTPEQAWALCPRGDWLLWLAERAGVDRRKLTSAACACARLVSDLMPPESARALSVVEAWCRGEASEDELRAAEAWAAWAASAAAWAAAWAAAEAAHVDDAMIAAFDGVLAIGRQAEPWDMPLIERRVAEFEAARA